MKQKLFLFSLLLTISQQVYSQSRINFDFEESYSQTKIASQWKTGVDNGVYSIDNEIRYSGKQSFKIFSPSNSYPRTAYLEIGQFLNKHLNRVIRIEAMIRFDSTQKVKPDITLDIRKKGRDTTLVSKIVTFNKEASWQKIALSFTLTDEQSNAYLSIRNNDKGTVWFDNIKVFSNDKEVSYKQAQVGINLKSTTIQQIISTNDSNFIFPTTFISKLSSKKIIGIGEGTHGSFEFRVIQQSLVKQLSKMEVDLLLAIEASASDCYRLNNYIATGAGNSKDILRQMNTNHFKYFCTEEFLDFLEWLKNENKKRRIKIKLYGVDVQYNNSSAQYIRRTDGSNSLIDTIVNICSRNRYLYPNDDNRNDLNLLEESLNQLLKNLNENKINSFDDFYIIQALRLQMIGQRTYLQDRDSLMAENIKTLNQQFPDSKIVFLANNTHCSSDDNYGGVGIKMTGHFLKKMFGDNYLSIGTVANQGYYTAQDFGKENKVMDGKGFYTSTDFTSQNVSSENKLHLSPIGSIEQYLSKQKKNIALVEMPKDTLNKMMIRDIGLVKRDCEQFSESKMNIYDYLIYFEKVIPTTIFPY